jgi:hypothetical protein
MPPSSKKPRQWLLTVVSAAALLPGCAQEHDAGDDEADNLDDEEHGPGHNAPTGSIVLPDGGRPVPDAGRWMGTIVHDAGFPFPGTIVYPDAGPVVGTVPRPDAGFVGSMPRPDAGPQDAGSADTGVPDAGAKDGGVKDAACSFLNGIVIIPPDASCVPYYPGVMPRD